jgi:hypothetical protein
MVPLPPRTCGHALISSRRPGCTRSLRRDPSDMIMRTLMLEATAMQPLSTLVTVARKESVMPAPQVRGHDCRRARNADRKHVARARGADSGAVVRSRAVAFALTRSERRKKS